MFAYLTPKNDVRTFNCRVASRKLDDKEVTTSLQSMQTEVFSVPYNLTSSSSCHTEVPDCLEKTENRVQNSKLIDSLLSIAFCT